MEPRHFWTMIFIITSWFNFFNRRHYIDVSGSMLYFSFKIVDKSEVIKKKKIFETEAVSSCVLTVYLHYMYRGEKNVHFDAERRWQLSYDKIVF